MIHIETTVNASAEDAWEKWTNPEDITKWAFASDDWEAPSAVNDVREGGSFTTVMAAKDGSTSFKFSGVYTKVVPQQVLEYAIEDGRKVIIKFESLSDNSTKILQDFDPEDENTEEMQRSGWQEILNNFKKHVERG